MNPESQHQPQYQPNRLSRRRTAQNTDPQRRLSLILSHQFNTLIENNHTTSDHWEEETSLSQNSLSRMTYHGKPFIYSWLANRKDLHGIIQPVKDLSLKASFFQAKGIDEIEKNDVYSHKINETSLLDVEKMELPLTPENIKRINRIFKAPRFRKTPDMQRNILQSLICLSTVPYAQPETLKSIPKSLERLRENLSAYFDYYLELIKSHSTSAEDDLKLALTFAWNSPWLPTALAVYLPARLHITPSSAAKIYEQKEVQHKELGAKIVWRQLRNVFMKQNEYTYRKNGLPQDLQTYQNYDPINDRDASEELKIFYKSRAHPDQYNTHLKSKELTDDFIKDYQRPIQRDIMRKQDKRLTYTMPENHTVKNITLTAQYKETTVIILHLKNGSHLTLEIDQKGELFGIPPALRKSQPHIQDRIITDIFQRLKEVRSKESQKISLHSLIRFPSPEKTGEKILSPNQESVIKPLKRKRIARYFTKAEPELPEIISPPHPPRFIPHSEDLIRSFLGEHAKQKDIDIIMNALSRCEQGWRDPEPIITQRSRKLSKLRAGSYRIALQDNGNSQFEINFLGPRKDFYKKFDRNPN